MCGSSEVSFVYYCFYATGKWKASPMRHRTDQIVTLAKKKKAQCSNSSSYLLPNIVHNETRLRSVRATLFKVCRNPSNRPRSRVCFEITVVLASVVAWIKIDKCPNQAWPGLTEPLGDQLQSRPLGGLSFSSPTLTVVPRVYILLQSAIVTL